MSPRRLVYRTHALRRIFERGISTDEVAAVVAAGDAIMRYDDDTPYPSRLLFATVNDRPLHVVAADVPGSDETVIITVYEPDPAQWAEDFRTRRRP